jgi:hypothetical protein
MSELGRIALVFHQRQHGAAQRLGAADLVVLGDKASDTNAIISCHFIAER